METKHTPTPWAVRIYQSSYIITAMDGPNHLVRVLGVSRDPAVSDETWARQCADARHIVECVNACEGIADPSAVPELLEALATFIEYHDKEMPLSFDTDAMWANARAAIAKATGQHHEPNTTKP